MFHSLQVRRAGFPQRMAYDAFCREFTVLETASDGDISSSSGIGRSRSDKPSQRCQDHEQLAVDLLLLPAVQRALSGMNTTKTAAATATNNTTELVLDAFRPGQTTLFFRADTLFTLRQLRAKLLAPAAVKLQRWWFALQGAGEWQRRFRIASSTVQRASALAADEGLDEVPAVRDAIEHAQSALAHAKPAIFAAVAAGIFASALSSPSRRTSHSPNHHLPHISSSSEGSNSTATELISVEKDAATTCWSTVMEAIAARAEVQLLHASRLKEIDACQGRAQIVLNASSNSLSNHARAKLSGLALEAIFAAKHARFAYRTQLQQWRAAHAGILGTGDSSALLQAPSPQPSQISAPSPTGGAATLARQRRGSVFGVGAAAVAAATTSVAARKETKRLARMTASLAAAAEARGADMNNSNEGSCSSHEQNQLSHCADQGSSSSNNGESVTTSLMGHMAAKKFGKSWKRTAHARASMSLESWVRAAQSKVEAAEAELAPCLDADEKLRAAVHEEEPRLEAAAAEFSEGSAGAWHELETNEQDFGLALDVRAAVEAANFALCHARDVGNHHNAAEYHASCEAALVAVDEATFRIEAEQQRRAIVAGVWSAAQRILDMQLETTQDPELADPGYLTASAPELAHALECAVADASEFCTNDTDFHRWDAVELEDRLACLEAHVEEVETLLAAAQEVMAAERRDRFNRFKSAFETPQQTSPPSSHHRHPVHVSPAIERLKAQKSPLTSATLNGPNASIYPAVISATFTGPPPANSAIAVAELAQPLPDSDNSKNAHTRSNSWQSPSFPQAGATNTAAATSHPSQQYADNAQALRDSFISDDADGGISLRSGSLGRDNSFAALSDIVPNDRVSFDDFNDDVLDNIAALHNDPRPATPPDDDEEVDLSGDNDSNALLSPKLQHTSPPQWPSFDSASVADSPSKFLPGLFARNDDGNRSFNQPPAESADQEVYDVAAIDEVEAATNAAAVAIQDEYSLNNLDFDDESPLELFDLQDGYEDDRQTDINYSPEEIFEVDEDIEDVEDAESSHSLRGVAHNSPSSFSSSVNSPVAPTTEMPPQPAPIALSNGSQFERSPDEPLVENLSTDAARQPSTTKRHPRESDGSGNRAPLIDSISEDRDEKQRRQERRRERERRREKDLPPMNSPSALPGTSSKNSKEERHRVVRLAVTGKEKSPTEQSLHVNKVDNPDLEQLKVRQKARQKETRKPRDERSSSRNRPRHEQAQAAAVLVSIDKLEQHDRHPSSSRHASRLPQSTFSQTTRRSDPHESFAQSSAALLTSPSTLPVISPLNHNSNHGTNESWASLDVRFRAMSQPDRFATVSGVELTSLLSNAGAAAAASAGSGTSALQQAAAYIAGAAESAATVDLVLELTLLGALDEKQRPLAVKTTLHSNRRKRSSSSGSSGSRSSSGASDDLWSTMALLGLGINAAAVADPAGKVKPRLELRLWARPKQAGASRVLLATCRKSLDMRADKIRASAATAGALADPQFVKAMLLEDIASGDVLSKGGTTADEPAKMALVSAFLDVGFEPPEYLAASK